MNVRRIFATVLLTTALLSQTACVRMIWTNGTTHGVGVETAVLPPTFRVNFLVFKSPSRGLYQLYRQTNIRTVQDVMWSLGRPPTIGFSRRCVLNWCFSISVDVFRGRVYGYIYDDPADLRTALIEAEARRNCLALTLFSNGNLSPNWTKKNAGCRTGSIPSAATRAPGAATGGDEVMVDGYEPDRPLNAEELARVEPDDRRYVNTAPEVERPAPDGLAPLVVVSEAAGAAGPSR